MPALAFVVFEEEKGNDNPGLIAKSGLLKTYIGTAMFHLFNRNKFRNGIHEFKIDMETDTSILAIRLPFPISLLSSYNRQYIERYILKVYTARDCLRCFVPAAYGGLGGHEQYSVDKSIQTIIFKALLLPVLEEIYLKCGIRLDNLDTVFVNGENTVELKTMVRQLEPFVRYVNVAASDKEAVESELSDICMDSGISIIVSSDFKSILRNADLIINLGEIAAISKFRIKTESVVIYFSSWPSTAVQGEYTFLSGVEYTFPESQYKIFGEDIFRNFGKAELTEILLAIKAGLLNGGIYNEATTAKILGIFKKNCCRITGLHGRRGILKLENVVKAVHLY